MKDSASAVGCGGLAGTIMWSVVLPLDVAKTRIQTAHPVRALSPRPLTSSAELPLRQFAGVWCEHHAQDTQAALTPTLICTN